ncbi:MAG TPA: response regulator transcription factor [Syntrophales bacterium]|nr:response regulator transcription factor [Syntrophales bacterium]
MTTIRVLLADDHKIIRDGLKTLIEKETGMEVIAEADNGRRTVRLAQKHQPNVIIMDVTMPDMNGIEATRKIMEDTAGVRIIGLSMHSDRRYVLGMLEAGASGYLLKDCAFEELATAIRNVAGGNTYLSPKIADVVVKGYLDKTPGPSHALGSALTPREREVLQLLAEGMAAKEIASHLNVSVKTVETHRRNMMEKLSMRSIAELTKYAVREGLVSIEG